MAKDNFLKGVLVGYLAAAGMLLSHSTAKNMRWIVTWRGSIVYGRSNTMAWLRYLMVRMYHLILLTCSRAAVVFISTVSQASLTLLNS
jgi:hypothetical protein